MKEHASVGAGKDCLTILSISPFEEDHAYLQAIVGCISKVVPARDFSTAKKLLESREVFLVICEREATPASWIEWLEYMESVPSHPFWIVTSRLADERLWAEVLNLGGWDVLAKPFDDREVLRTVHSTVDRYRCSTKAIAKQFSPSAAY